MFGRRQKYNRNAVCNNVLCKELNIKRVPALENISVKVQNLTQYNWRGEEEKLLEDTLFHAGVAFCQNNLIKYINPNGDTLLAPNSRAVKAELANCGYTLVTDHFATLVDSSKIATYETENYITRARMIQNGEPVDNIFFAQGYGLSYGARERIEIAESSGNYCHTADTHFATSNFKLYLGPSTPKEDAIALLSLMKFPVEGTREIIEKSDNIEEVEESLRINREEISNNFEFYNSTACIYATATPTEESEPQQ